LNWPLGTLFFDEIAALSPLLQVKLLRMLEEQPIWGRVIDMKVDVRVIATSNRDLEKAAHQGKFRQDLYYQLSTIAIFIPPLRDRRDDILPLVEFFIERFNKKFKKSMRGITDETRRLLLAHSWPGNVRELKSAIHRAVVCEDEPLLCPTHLPFRCRARVKGLSADHNPYGERQLPSGQLRVYSSYPGCI
jgi:transcriptional regulator with PAS, ATPase and Fis domain